MDDVVVKMVKSDTLIDDLHETFDNLDRYNIKMNPLKWAFVVPSGQLLSYYISKRGIKANPKNISTILVGNMP